jgi:NAD(P)-dependent dehydrogenase (short-subunit alcohol dehydrogenase family)
MILITGASKGIGKYLLEKFIYIGERAIGTFNNTAPNSGLTQYLSKVDIRNAVEVKEWLLNIKPTDEKLVLLNCAGINYNAVGHKADYEHWCNVINVNLSGTFNVISQVLPLMRDRNYGRIINLSSVVAQMGIPGTSAYSASKSGMWGMTRALAVENAKKGITINSINLGYFNIGMISEVPEEYQVVIKSKIPTGRFGNPEEIWNTVQYIINNSYLNGTSIDINGGLY